MADSTMTEADYWPRLEYRVTRELARMQDSALSSLWCDGFVPESYLVDQPAPCITGRAWIGRGPVAQDEWSFTLVLHQTTLARDVISWSALLPPDESTGWLAVDVEGQWLAITPWNC